MPCYKEEVRIWLYATMMIDNTFYIFNMDHLYAPRNFLFPLQTCIGPLERT